MEENVTQFFMGSKLGDGGFVKKSPKHNTYVVFKHSENQFEYLLWKYIFLKEKGLINENSTIKKVNMNTASCFPNYKQQFRFACKSNAEITRIKEKTLIDTIKELDLFGLTIWILDDGNFYKGTCKIAMGSKYHYIQKIADILNEKFCDIKFNVYIHSTNPIKSYLRISKRDFNTLKNIILNYIPSNLDIIKEKILNEK